MKIASGRSRPGRRASPPAWAMESKPMNDANNSTEAGSSVSDSGAAVLVTTGASPRAESACRKSTWS
jgi:hypothetical protein